MYTFLIGVGSLLLTLCLIALFIVCGVLFIAFRIEDFVD